MGGIVSAAGSGAGMFSGLYTGQYNAAAVTAIAETGIFQKAWSWISGIFQKKDTGTSVASDILTLLAQTSAGQQEAAQIEAARQNYFTIAFIAIIIISVVLFIFRGRR